MTIGQSSLDEHETECWIFGVPLDIVWKGSLAERKKNNQLTKATIEIFLMGSCILDDVSDLISLRVERNSDGSFFRGSIDWTEPRTRRWKIITEMNTINHETIRQSSFSFVVMHFPCVIHLKNVQLIEYSISKNAGKVSVRWNGIREDWVIEIVYSRNSHIQTPLLRGINHIWFKFCVEFHRHL